LFGGGKAFDIVSHIAKKAKDDAVVDAWDLEKICFEVSKGEVADIKGREFLFTFLGFVF
jgi:hypothetical protein